MRIAEVTPPPGVPEPFRKADIKERESELPKINPTSTSLGLWGQEHVNLAPPFNTI